MPKTFARKTEDGTRRDASFLKTLSKVSSEHLPELQKPPFGAPPRPANWKTFRLRPEIADIITTLQARYAANSRAGVMLTPSEIIAAALVEAMPRLTAHQFSR